MCITLTNELRGLCIACYVMYDRCALQPESCSKVYVNIPINSHQTFQFHTARVFIYLLRYRATPTTRIVLLELHFLSML